MVFIKHNSIKSDIFFNRIFIPGFSGSRFFRAQVFQRRGFSGSRFFRAQVLQGPGPWSGFRVQGPGPSLRSSHLIKLFSSEVHFTNQRSNLYCKWRKWLMWGEDERRNEWKFKNLRMKRKQRKIRITWPITKRKLESCGNG